jgi:hypothetical protein
LLQLNRARGFSSFFCPVRFSSAQLTLSALFSLPAAASTPLDVVAPCHASFPCNQDELTVFASSSVNDLSHHLSSQVETEALNLHHRRRPHSSESSTPTLHWYKHVISTFATLHITQLCLHFASSLASASRHRRSIHRRHSLSPPSHVHHPSIQRHPRWRTSWSTFAPRTTYQYVNLHKKIFWNSATSRGVIN